MSRADTVVLVHGLWLHGSVMVVMKHGLERRGYRVLTYSYPTVRYTLNANIERLVRFCSERAPPRFHLVGHSMGGLVALCAAAALPRERVERIVLLGTPYGDCYAGRSVQRLPGGASIIGRCMGQWLAERRRLDPAAHDVGVIAGTGRIGLGRLFVPDLPLPNDGVVSVEETHVPGMRDHIVLPVSHTVMLVSPEVTHQACAYLANGRFDHARGTRASLN